MSLPPHASAPPAYTSQRPVNPVPSQAHPQLEPIRYRVEGNTVYAQVPVYPTPQPSQQTPQLLVAHQPPTQYITTLPAMTWGPQPYIARFDPPYQPYPYPQPQMLHYPPAFYAAPAPTYLTQPQLQLQAQAQVPPSHIPPGYKAIPPSAQTPHWTAKAIESESESEDDSGDWIGMKKVLGRTKAQKAAKKKAKKEAESRRIGVVKIKWF